MITCNLAGQEPTEFPEWVTHHHNSKARLILYEDDLARLHSIRTHWQRALAARGRLPYLPDSLMVKVLYRGLLEGLHAYAKECPFVIPKYLVELEILRGRLVDQDLRRAAPKGVEVHALTLGPKGVPAVTSLRERISQLNALPAHGLSTRELCWWVLWSDFAFWLCQDHVLDRLADTLETTWPMKDQMWRIRKRTGGGWWYAGKTHRKHRCASFPEGEQYEDIGLYPVGSVHPYYTGEWRELPVVLGPDWKRQRWTSLRGRLPRRPGWVGSRSFREMPSQARWCEGLTVPLWKVVRWANKALTDLPHAQIGEGAPESQMRWLAAPEVAPETLWGVTMWFPNTSE